MITKLKTNISKFTHVFHIADIQVRLNSRIEEYKEVFEILYSEIENSPPNTVVAIVGDIFHSKCDLSPECVDMTVDLFTRISELRPLVIVSGNHDAMLSNKSRLDSLTPIVKALKNPNIYYLRKTGLYGIGNILFNNMSIFDSPDKYIKGKDIPEVYRNQYEHIIALFHGPVDQAVLDTGYTITNPAVMPPMFDDHHLALLGDIHKRQDIQEYSYEENKPFIHYVGSLIQQNHGESLEEHGYSLWDLSTYTYTFKEIPNNYGYFTIDIVKGKLSTDLEKMPAKVRLRVNCHETVATEVKQVISDLRTKADIIDISYERIEPDTNKLTTNNISKHIVLTKLTDVKHQNELIKKYITETLKIEDGDKLKHVLKINKEINKLIDGEGLPKSYLWKPIRFEFDNMFTYGEGNVIDFTKMNGVYGIFGPNRIGKSSILSALTFCLFDKFDRGYKGSHVLNSQKTSFRCKLEFELLGTKYYIERKGEAGRNGNVKVSVRFWKFENGEEIELHGEDRRDTNEIIRLHVGTYEDFILTAASIQSAKNLTSFIDMGNSERKDLLVKFIGLNVFDKLHDKGNEKYREISAILKSHNDRDYGEELKQCNESLEQIKTLFEVREKLVNELQEKISTINEKIIKETSNYIKLEEISSSSLEELQERLEKSKNTLEKKKDEVDKNKEKINKLQSEIEKITEKINKVNSNLMESYKKYKSLSNQIQKFKGEMDLKKAEIKVKLEKVEKLKTHRYNRQCKFCVENPFVQDAYKARDELEDDKVEVNKMMQKWDELQSQLKEYEWAETAYEEHANLLSSKNNLKDTHSELSQKDTKLSNELKNIELLIKKNEEEIEIYKRNEESIKSNVKVKNKINKLNLELSQIKIDLKNANGALLEVSNKKGQCESEIKKLTGLLEEVKGLEQDVESYKYYLSAVSRDGIPYQVICSTVPEIEKEVNSILSQVVDFTVQFETDGKNIVPYITYDYGRWPIELSSGFERFVASIVIRVALMNISNLSKPNFISIDEGFGTLDPDNLASMASFLTFLKNNFDFVLIISHLFELKDAVDAMIEITRSGNFSQVKYE